MEKEQVKKIEEMSISQASKIKRENLCEGCGLWPCYAESPNCLRYEDEEK